MKIGSRSRVQRFKVTFLPPDCIWIACLLEKDAKVILTDSGGVQKEAYFLGVPCMTLRPKTEWVETVEAGWNVLVDGDKDKITEVVSGYHWPNSHPQIFGDGQAAQRIMEALTNHD